MRGGSRAADETLKPGCFYKPLAALPAKMVEGSTGPVKRAGLQVALCFHQKLANDRTTSIFDHSCEEAPPAAFTHHITLKK